MAEAAASLAEPNSRASGEAGRRSPVPGRRSLFALPIVAALPVVAFAVIVVVLFDREQRRAVESQLVHYARSAVQASDLILTSRSALLQSLSAVAEDGDAEAFRTLAERLLDRQGDLLYVALEPQQRGLPIAVEARRGVVPPVSAPRGSPLPGGEEDQYFASFAMVSKGGQPIPAVLLRASTGAQGRSMVTAALDATPFSTALLGQEIPQEWIAAILDPNHRIVGRSRAQGEFVGTEATASLVSELEQTDEKFFYSFNKEGERVYTAFSTSPLTGWTAAVGAPAGLIEGPLRRTEYAMIGGGTAAMVLALLLGGILVRNVTERHHAERRLLELESDARAERRVSEIASNFPGVIYRRAMDPSGNVSFPYLSPGTERLVGGEIVEQLRGPAAFEELLRTAVVPEDQDLWRQAARRSAANLEPYDVEGRVRTPDGIRWVRSTASTRKAPDGTVQWDGVVLDITDLKQAEAALREQTRRLETINRINASLTAELDLDRLVQAITDASTQLSGAQFGAFFYNLSGPEGEAYTLYTLSGAPREAFERFPMPRNTAVFGPTFSGAGIVRSDDITRDPRYGKSEPYRGMPKGHLPVRSYLAVPVISRSGETIGGLFFGHPEPGIFGEGAEQIVAAIAAQAAIAIDNATLYRKAEQEIEARRKTEEHQALLLAELNHRVKNTLAVVLAISQQTLKHSPTPEAFNAAFQGRLQALARAHTVLTEGNWTTAPLRTLVEEALAPHVTADQGRISIDGPEVIVPPKPALAISLVMHELATNALKYGALSSAEGRVAIAWERCDSDAAICLEWQEHSGRSVSEPDGHGFGSKLIEINVTHELGGSIDTEFRQSGFCCRMVLPWDPVSRELTPYRD